MNARAIGGDADRTCGELRIRAVHIPVAGAPGERNALHMSTTSSYAVSWREAGGVVHVGKLQLRAGLLQLTGRTHVLSVHLDHIAGVTVLRTPGERPALVIDRAGCDRLTVSSLSGIGAVRELAALLTAYPKPPHRSYVFEAVKTGEGEHEDDVAAADAEEAIPRTGLARVPANARSARPCAAAADEPVADARSRPR